MSAATSHQPNALKRALLLDATASGGMGLLLVLAAGSLERLLGLPRDLLSYVGLFLLPFAGLLLWVATRRTPATSLVAAIVVGNVLWVAASVALLLSDLVNPTVLGEAFVIAQAAAVTLFAYLEYAAVRARSMVVAKTAS
ncbi:MAG: hypothetical protein ACT4P6_03255 [Gemmatimonadaceae bacterium]